MSASAKEIAFFTVDSRPNRGGIATYLDGLCASLAAQGHGVRVYSTVPGSSAAGAGKYTTLELKARPTRALGKRLGDAFTPTRRFNTWRYYRRLEALANAEVRSMKRADIAVIFWWNIESHFWCRALRKARVDYAIVCQGAEFFVGLNARTRSLRRIDFLAAKRLIPNSRATGDSMRRAVDPSLGYTVSYPVSDSSFMEVTDEAARARRAKLGIAMEAPVVLFVGRLVKRKGADLLIEAFARLKDRQPALKLVIAGDGPEKDALRSLAAARGLAAQTIFIENFDDVEKCELYRACDIFAMPNRTLSDTDWEGFGIVFIEAALAGKPSVGGLRGGSAEAIVDGETGFLVDDGSADALAEKLEILMNDGALRRRMGEAARERARRDFTGAAVARGFADALFGGKEVR